MIHHIQDLARIICDGGDPLTEDNVVVWNRQFTPDQRFLIILYDYDKFGAQPLVNLLFEAADQIVMSVSQKLPEVIVLPPLWHFQVRLKEGAKLLVYHRDPDSTEQGVRVLIRQHLSLYN